MFDSGLGGLAVLEALVTKFPTQSFAYIADTAWMPYGSKVPQLLVPRMEAVFQAFEKALPGKGLLMGCNTAAASLAAHPSDSLTQYLSTRTYADIVYQTVQGLTQQLETQESPKKVAFLATATTVRSQYYRRLLEQQSSPLHEFKLFPAPGLAEAVEGKTLIPLDFIAKACLKPVIEYQPDYLVLACTHYLHVYETLSALMPKSVELINPVPWIINSIQGEEPTSHQSTTEDQQISIWCTDERTEQFDTQIQTLQLTSLDKVLTPARHLKV